MSTTNPTRLQVGHEAVIDGQRMTVRGRVVLSMVADDGETYYWNEFNLVGDAGRAVTLVFEETENGPTWKWFGLFEPLRPPGVAEAKAVRVGQSVDLGEGRLHVTMVDQTRVEHIEGEAPAGVERGDVAHYFNAESREETFVVSWSGEEIEFYRGRELARGRVEALFKLAPQLAVPASFRSEYRAGMSGLTKVFIGVAVLAVVAIIFTSWTPRESSRSFPLMSKPVAPPSPPLRLETGARGVLGGQVVAVAGHAVERVVRMGGKFERHEYVLADGLGAQSLLVNSAGGNSREWHLLRLAEAPAGFNGYDAAALRQDKVATIAGRSLQVFQLFKAEVRSSDGAPTEMWANGDGSYGLLARANGELVFVRWNQTGLQWYQGRPLPEAEVRAALAAPAIEKARAGSL